MRQSIPIAPGRCNLVGEPGQVLASEVPPIHGHVAPGRARALSVPPGSLVVNQGAGGLGDALLGAFAVKGLASANPERLIVYKAAPQTLPFLALFDLGANVALATHDWDDGNAHPKGNPHPGDLQMNPGYGDELRSRGKHARLGRNCRNLGGVIPERPTLRDCATLLAAGRDYAGAVLLSPFSTWATREWPLHHWLTLERLLREEGYRVVVLDAGPTARCAPLKSEKLLDAPAERVAAVTLNAACVVSNDSGLAHLGGLLGTKTLVLCGQVTGREIYAPYGDNVSWLEGHLDCRGCWWQPPLFSAKCEPTCPNLASISPQEVTERVKELAGPPAPPPYGETSKAHARRLREGWYAEHFRAPAIDVGCWIDPVLPGFPVRRWDQMFGDGDATFLGGVEDASLATVYASHSLEHMNDPVLALRNWWRVLRPGGRLIVCVPHQTLYEGKPDLPSRWNGDHKTFWLPEAPPPGAPAHWRGLRQTIEAACVGGELLSLRVLDEGHSYPDPLVHPRGEYSIEAIVLKPASQGAAR